MKTYIKTLIITSLIALSLLACNKDELIKFEGDSLLYFMWAKEGKAPYFERKIDSISISFAYDLVKKPDTLIYIPFKIQGFLSDKDREVNIRVTKESTAKSNIHFNIPSNIVIPADSIMSYIPITIKRTPDMKDQVLSLKLEFVENQNFKTGVYGGETSFDAKNQRPVTFNQFEITISDSLTQPEFWDKAEPYFGKFSAKKIRLIAEVNNIPLPKYNLYNSPEFSNTSYYASILSRYLAKEKNNGTPVLEDDGTEMTLE